MSKKLVTIVIPTYNSEKTLDNCLKSIFNQRSFINKLEVLVIDNYSKDKTLKIAGNYKVKIIMSREKDDLVSKMKALKIARGDYFIYLDSDIDIIGNKWFENMLYPLLKDKKIAASFCRFVANKSDNSYVRYLSYDVLQRDPIYEFFSPSVESTIISETKEYFVCKYSENNIPPSGLCLYRKKILTQLWNVDEENKFLELDNLVRMVNSGHNLYAYVKKVGIHHPFVNNLSHLLSKRLRNINRVYLHQSFERQYKWFDLRSFLGILKILIWIIYATTFILPLARGVIKAIKYKDSACLLEPVVVFTETWVIIFGMVWYTIF